MWPFKIEYNFLLRSLISPYLLNFIKTISYLIETLKIKTRGKVFLKNLKTIQFRMTSLHITSSVSNHVTNIKISFLILTIYYIFSIDQDLHYGILEQFNWQNKVTQ